MALLSASYQVLVAVLLALVRGHYQNSNRRTASDSAIGRTVRRPAVVRNRSRSTPTPI